MKWEDFIKIAGKLPIVNKKLFLPGASSVNAVEVQFSRWQKTGKLIQLKRGMYLLAEPYRKIDLFEPYVASALISPSYISLEKALEYHDLIPEGVSVYTSVTTKRQGKFITKVGVYDYRHIKSSLFWGYKTVCMNKQTAFIASPEKALLDFFYLKKIRVTLDYLNEMRLQNVEKIDLDILVQYAKRYDKKSLFDAVRMIEKYIVRYKKDEKTL